jgi:hypothetical protein
MINLKTLFRRKPLPLVPDFLRDGIAVGDTLVTNHGRHVNFAGIDGADNDRPIMTTDYWNFTLNGWGRLDEQGDLRALHIVKILRGKKVVAQGQRYYTGGSQ